MDKARLVYFCKSHNYTPQKSYGTLTVSWVNLTLINLVILVILEYWRLFDLANVVQFIKNMVPIV